MISRSPTPPTSIVSERLAALQAHTCFADAMRASAVGIVAMYQGRRLTNWLMDDRGRLLFSYYALYLHFTRDPADPSSGLTPTRMKAICEELNICSAGRAVAMLTLMRLTGYLVPDDNVADRRRRPLLATARLIDLLRQRWRLHFAAMAPLFADGEQMLRALDDPDFVRGFVVAMQSAFRAGFRFSSDAQLLRLADRNAGMMIMASLIAGAEADDTVPPTRPVPISISALARRFAVSRVHVIALLDDAARAGLMKRGQAEGSAVISIEPPLARELRNFFARMYLYFADCARFTLRGLASR